MLSPVPRFVLLALLLWAVACSPTESNDPQDTSVAEDTVEDQDVAADTAEQDTSSGQDTTAPDDTVATDTTPQDTGTQDTQTPDDTGGGQDVVNQEPFGMLSGTCGELDTELTDGSPHLFENSIDFGTDPFDDPEDVPRLSVGGKYILDQENAGGSSELSEVFAFEVLHRCEEATLLKTEKEITYDINHTGSITDILVDIDGNKIGVSVTRAFKFPPSEPYTVADAERLLDGMDGKLAGVNESSMGVAAEDAWAKQILFIMAYAPEHVASLQTVFDDIRTNQPALLDDTIVYITVSNGDDGWLY